MNINPVSFKGTFCISPETAKPRALKKLLSKKDEYEMVFEPGNYKNPGQVYINTPFEFDDKMVKILEKLRIPFKEISPADSLSTDSICSRICLSDYDQISGNILIKADTEILDAAMKKCKDFYVGWNGRNGSGYKYDRFKRYLMTNQPINATSIYLKREKDGGVSAHVKDGRHRFAVLRDMGLTKIPVSIDKDSIELAKEINLI